LPDLGVQHLQIGFGRLAALARGPKHIRRPPNQLLLPLHDLGRMHFELLGQFRQRPSGLCRTQKASKLRAIA
jgi:hypothetical protein